LLERGGRPLDAHRDGRAGLAGCEGLQRDRPDATSEGGGSARGQEPSASSRCQRSSEHGGDGAATLAGGVGRQPPSAVGRACEDGWPQSVRTAARWRVRRYRHEVARVRMGGSERPYRGPWIWWCTVGAGGGSVAPWAGECPQGISAGWPPHGQPVRRTVSVRTGSPCRGQVVPCHGDGWGHVRDRGPAPGGCGSQPP
jgi:hypothetical protein